jgi:hypothetical protein
MSNGVVVVPSFPAHSRIEAPRRSNDCPGDRSDGRSGNLRHAAVARLLSVEQHDAVLKIQTPPGEGRDLFELLRVVLAGPSTSSTRPPTASSRRQPARVRKP